MATTALVAGLLAIAGVLDATLLGASAFSAIGAIASPVAIVYGLRGRRDERRRKRAIAGAAMGAVSALVFALLVVMLITIGTQ